MKKSPECHGAKLRFSGSGFLYHFFYMPDPAVDLALKRNLWKTIGFLGLSAETKEKRGVISMERWFTGTVGIAATRHGLTSQILFQSAAAVFQKRTCTIWLFNIAMENHLFLIGKPSIYGDFPWLCQIIRWYMFFSDCMSWPLFTKIRTSCLCYLPSRFFKGSGIAWGCCSVLFFLMSNKHEHL